MYYLDTSVLVSLFAQEKTSETTLTWVAERSSLKLTISDWTITEFSSALGVKLRTAQINAKDRSRALSQFDLMTQADLIVLDVKSGHFKTAATFMNDTKLALRGGDALHLAIASDNQLILATLDQRLAEAGPSLGILTELIA